MLFEGFTMNNESNRGWANPEGYGQREVTPFSRGIKLSNLFGLLFCKLSVRHLAMLNGHGMLAYGNSFVLPGSVANNSSELPFANRKMDSKGSDSMSTRIVKGADFISLLVGDLGSVMLLAPRSLWAMLTSLGNHVLDVVLMATEEEMVPALAIHRVTSVENKNPFREISVLDDPADSMGKDGTSIKQAHAAICSRALQCFASPKPASIGVFGLFNSLPEKIDISLGQWRNWFRLLDWHVSTISQAIGSVQENITYGI